LSSAIIQGDDITIVIIAVDDDDDDVDVDLEREGDGVADDEEEDDDEEEEEEEEEEDESRSFSFVWYFSEHAVAVNVFESVFLDETNEATVDQFLAPFDLTYVRRLAESSFENFCFFLGGFVVVVVVDGGGGSNDADAVVVVADVVVVDVVVVEGDEESEITLETVNWGREKRLFKVASWEAFIVDSGDIVVVGGGSGVCLTDELMACHGVFLSSNLSL